MKFNKDLLLKSIVAIVFILAAYGMYGISTYEKNATAEITQNVHDRIDNNKKLSAKEKTVEKDKRIDLESDEAVEIKQKHASKAAGFVVTLTDGLLKLGLLIILISTIINMIMNPKGIVKSVIGIGIFLVLLIVSYSLADATEVLGANNEVLLSLEDGYTADKVASLTKWSGAGLNLTYILLSISGLLFVGGLLKSLIKS